MSERLFKCQVEGEESPRTVRLVPPFCLYTEKNPYTEEYLKEEVRNALEMGVLFEDGYIKVPKADASGVVPQPQNLQNIGLLMGRDQKTRFESVDVKRVVSELQAQGVQALDRTSEEFQQRLVAYGDTFLKPQSFLISGEKHGIQPG